MIDAIELEGLEKFVLSDHPKIPGLTVITLADDYETSSLVVVDKRESVGAKGEEYVSFPQQDMQDQLGDAGVSGGKVFTPSYKDSRGRSEFPPLVNYNSTKPNQAKPDFKAVFPVGEQISRRKLTYSGGSIIATRFPTSRTVSGTSLSNQSFSDGNVQVDVVEITVGIWDQSLGDGQKTSTGATVTVNDQTYTPDANGNIIFEVAPGTDFTIYATQGNLSYQITQKTFEIVEPTGND